nr:hypothetical protein [Pandoraea terrae]
MLLAASCLGASAAHAQVSVNVGIGIAPPAPIYEPVPPPRAGYVWAPGYWAWDDYGHKHKWKRGRWELERPGYAYESPHWERGGGGWVFVPERWDDRRGRYDRRDEYDKHYDKRGGYHCPPGHAKKGEC